MFYLVVYITHRWLIVIKKAYVLHYYQHLGPCFRQ